MNAANDVEKSDEGMLPGFRFHPTDDELVGFYLKRKVQKRPVSIELIRQLDIYKYDPWDLPKLAMAGEKEWYFYCPRDRKYRNSARPNRVTGAGFWKATGTDRAIYTADGATCIGLKKSLVFYRGRAAKGIKTDWMMHEYRLPPSSGSSSDKDISANDSWAICRIFRKTCSAAQRCSQPHSGAAVPLPEAAAPEEIPLPGALHQGISCPAEARRTSQPIFSYSSADLAPLLFSSGGLASAMTLPPPSEAPAPWRCSLDVAALLQYMQPQLVGDAERNSSSSSAPTAPCHSHRRQPLDVQALSTIDLLLEMTGNLGRGGEATGTKKNQKVPDAVFGDGNGESQWGGALAAAVLPFAPLQNCPEAWKPGWERELPNLLE